MLQKGLRSARRSAEGAALVSAAALGISSCYFTSSFDGLTPDESGGAKGGSDSSPTSGGTAGSVASGGTEGPGGAGSGGTGGSGASTASAGAGPGGTGGTTGGTGAGGDPPFPATQILDDFNRPDGDPGQQWQQTIDGSYAILMNQLIPKDGKPEAIIWDKHYGPNQEVYVTFESFESIDAELEIFMRNQDYPNECNSLVASYNNFSGRGHVVSVDYCVNDQWFDVGEVEVTLDPGDQLGMRGYEDGTVKVYRNGVELGAWDASAWEFGKAGGRIGIFAYGLSSNVVFDDFGGGEF
jgi:hypothetical protein